MPRGVAIPEIRQRLFAAVERVIARDGPGGLSGRSVTGEAGVATGLLYAHFTNLDQFLADYAVDRAFLVSAEVAALPERAGTGSVVGNLYDAVVATPLTTVGALVRLHVSRPELAERVDAVLGDRTAGLDAVENAAATYLAEEQRLGRFAATADPDALALALVGALHRLVLAGASEADVRARIQRTITALIENITTATPRRPAQP